MISSTSFAPTALSSMPRKSTLISIPVSSQSLPITTISNVFSLFSSSHSTHWLLVLLFSFPWFLLPISLPSQLWFTHKHNHSFLSPYPLVPFSSTSSFAPVSFPSQLSLTHYSFTCLSGCSSSHNSLGTLFSNIFGVAGVSKECLLPLRTVFFSFSPMVIPCKIQKFTWVLNGQLLLSTYQVVYTFSIFNTFRLGRDLFLPGQQRNN